MCVVDEATMRRKPLFASLLLRAPSGNPQLLAQHEDAHAEKDKVGTEIRRGCDRSNGTTPAAPAVGWCYECLDVSPWPRPSTALPSPGGSRLVATIRPLDCLPNENKFVKPVIVITGLVASPPSFQKAARGRLASAIPRVGGVPSARMRST